MTELKSRSLKKQRRNFFAQLIFFSQKLFFAKFNLNGSVVFRESATTSNKFSRPRIDLITFRFSKKIVLIKKSYEPGPNPIKKYSVNLHHVVIKAFSLVKNGHVTSITPL